MNHTTRAIRIIISIALALSMVVAGISLASLQQQSRAASEAEKHEQNTKSAWRLCKEERKSAY
jgi:Flp pilus assembly protein CpaB